MKYKLFALSILTSAMLGCASHPMQSAKHLPLNQQVYQGYEKLMSKQSYAFEGRMTFKMEMDEAKKSQHTSIAPQEIQQRQQVLNQLLAQPHQLTAIQQQWLQEGIAEATKKKTDSIWSKPTSDKINSLIKAFLERYYIAVDGVVDLKHGQISLNPKLGYHAKNVQGWIAVPLALDLGNNKAYADISAISPLLTDPKYDGQYVVFDYTELLKKSNFNSKPLLEVIREFMLVNSALAPEKAYQVLSLTAQDKQIGGVQRIRYVANYSEIMAQSSLFLYVNKKYLKTVLPQAEQLAAGDVSQLGKMFTAEGVSGKADATMAQPAEKMDAALERYYTAMKAFEPAYSEDETDAYATEEQDAESGDVETADYLKEIEDNLIASQALQKQQDEILNKFAAYQTDRLVMAEQMQKIVAQQPEAYAQLVKAASESFKDIALFEQSSFYNDLVLDAKGRLVRSEMNFKIGDFADLGIKNMTVLGTVNFHSYGSAKIDQQQLKNAVSFKQASNENAILSLGNAWDELTRDEPDVSSKTESQSWSKTQRYEKIAESLTQQNVKFLDAYATLYRYAYLLEGEDVEESEFDLKDLNDTARWTAIYYADEHGLPLTAKEKAEYDQSPDEWYYYDESIADSVWDILSTQQTHKKLVQQFQQLRKQGKTDAQIFAALYLYLETENEKRETGQKNVKFDQRFLEYVKVLADLAIDDLKTQKINTDKLKRFDTEERYWFNETSYTQVYQLFIQ